MRATLANEEKWIMQKIAVPGEIRSYHENNTRLTALNAKIRSVYRVAAGALWLSVCNLKLEFDD